jgi:putative glutathione S-transferase
MKPQFPTEQSESGEFQRQEDAFREWISNDGSTPYPAVAGRYHLYVSLACPWASRTVIFRKLKGLEEEVIGMTIVDPIRDDEGWAFRDPSGKIPPGAPFESTDPVNGFKFLSEAYKATDPDFDERVTVPVLWDKVTKRIVNNCEDDICRMFNNVFNKFAKHKDVDLFPKDIEAEHVKLCDFLKTMLTTAFTKPGSLRASGPTSLLAVNFSKRWMNWRCGYRRVATCLIIASWKQTGGFSARWYDSMPFTTAISSAICVASSITRTCRVI